MRQIDLGTYEVEPGEEVAIEWTAFGVIQSGIAMAIDERVLDPDQEDPPVFRFRASADLGTRHFVAAQGSFPAGTGADARFESTFSGSAGVGIDGPTIRASDPELLRTIVMTFDVVESAAAEEEEE